MPTGVAVTGIGVVSPLGPSREQYRDALLNGMSGVTTIGTFDVSTCRTRIGAPVVGFDATAWIPPMKLRRMDDTARYAVVVTRQAFEDAGYPLTAPADYEATMKKLDKVIGLKLVKAIHLNDSKKELGSRVDRHEHIGRGKIGLEGFRHLLNDPRFAAVPMYLETPKEDDDGEPDGINQDRKNLKTLRSLIAN